MRFQEIHLKKAPDCSLCGPHAVIKELVDYEQFCGVPYREHKPAMKTDHLITPAALAEKLKTGEALQLIDVRAPVEQQISTLPGAVLIPIDQLEQHLDRLDREKPIVCYCRTGMRSGRAVRLLIENGISECVQPGRWYQCLGAANRSGHVAILIILFENGFTINVAGVVQ